MSILQALTLTGSVSKNAAIFIILGQNIGTCVTALLSSVSANKNGDFYAFYNKFVNDSTYRAQSLAEVVDFSGPDPEDDFARMEGSIMPEQLELFAPELPKDMIYNIVYGEGSIKGNTRIFVVRGIANGLETELTFRKTKGGFILEKINT